MSKVLPEAKYTKFGEKIRHVIPGPVQCSVACGGRNCKWENPARWPEQDQVIKGVFSSWVIEDVVAMSRPSTEVIVQYDIIKQFKDNNICSIINLQRPGEHASCGPPLNKESLFTYDPKVFMDNDVFFYNFGWKDYGVTSLETILDMVKVMTFALSEGKVAVHCHAGLGRTGDMLYLLEIVVPHAERLSLEQFLHRQRHLLHGFESRQLRYMPKLVSVICRRLIEIANASQDSAWCDVRSNSSSKPRSARKKKEALRRSNTVETLKETIPGAFVNEKLETDELVDSVDSQKMDAILSPRVTRRKDSARSRSSSEAKSQSRPESPTMSLDISTEVEIPIDQTRETSPPSRKTPTSPILVTCAPAQMVPVENDDAELDKLSGNPNVVLVKQGSRPVLLSTMAEPQSHTDTNSNNNNQTAISSEIRKIPSDVSLNSTSSRLNESSALKNDQPHIQNDLKLDSKQDEVSSTHLNNMDQHVLNDSSHLDDLPSPMPSAYEPTISPRALPNECGHDIAIGEKSSRENPEQTGDVFLQEDCLRSPYSLKNLTLSLLAGDSMVSESDDQYIDFDEDADVNDGQNMTANQEKLKRSRKDYEVEDLEVTSCEELNEEEIDLEIEKICETTEDGEDFIEHSQEEVENAVQRSSTISKVSWSEASDGTGTDEKQEMSVPIHDETEGRQTPLMYRPRSRSVRTMILHFSWKVRKTRTPLDICRAGKTLDFLDGAQTDIECELEVSKDDIVTKKNPEVEDELLQLSLLKPTVREGNRPKSAGFLKRFAEKNRNDNAEKSKSQTTISMAQSLCDLTGATAVSRDDMELMRSELNHGVSLPMSPSSKSSTSDDILTHSGASSARKIKDPITVAMALAYKLTNDEWIWEKVYSKQVELNTREGAWSSLDSEGDPYVLSSLMWSWVEHLSKPILASDQVETLIKQAMPDSKVCNHETECPDPVLFEKALSGMDKPISSSLRCILDCLSSLPPLTLELELSVIKRCIAAFTHSNMENGNIASKDAENQKNNEQLVSLIQNYLVKTTVRNTKKKSVSDSIDSNDSTRKRSSEPVLEVKTTELLPSSQLNTEYPIGDGDTATGGSKVPELPPRIAVS